MELLTAPIVYNNGENNPKFNLSEQAQRWFEFIICLPHHGDLLPMLLNHLLRYPGSIPKSG